MKNVSLLSVVVIGAILYLVLKSQQGQASRAPAYDNPNGGATNVAPQSTFDNVLKTLTSLSDTVRQVSQSAPRST